MHTALRRRSGGDCKRGYSVHDLASRVAQGVSLILMTEKASEIQVRRRGKRARGVKTAPRQRRLKPAILDRQPRRSARAKRRHPRYRINAPGLAITPRVRSVFIQRPRLDARKKFRHSFLPVISVFTSAITPRDGAPNGGGALTSLTAPVSQQVSASARTDAKADHTASGEVSC